MPRYVFGFLHWNWQRCRLATNVHAESKLSEVAQLVPTEPAGWANWGVLALRQRNYDVAADRLNKARGPGPRGTVTSMTCWEFLREIAAIPRKRLPI